MAEHKYRTAAVIPVKGKSLRAPSKNFRPFGDSNLTLRKIELLKTIKELDAIYVSSDSEYILELAAELGCITVRRDPDGPYSGACDASTLFYHLAESCDAENILVCLVTAPLITADTIRNSLRKFDEALELGHDSVNSVQNNKEFFWRDGKPLNYDPSRQVRSQDLPDIYSLTFGVSVLKRETMLASRNLVGFNPLWYTIPALEAVDVDHTVDMCMAELLWVNGIRCQADVDKYYAFHSTRYPLPAPVVLDSSLSELCPDGECAYDPDLQARRAYVAALCAAGVQYVEVGARVCPPSPSPSPSPSSDQWQRCTDETIRALRGGLPADMSSKLGILAQPSRSDLTDFTPQANAPFEFVRLFLPQQQGGLEGCPALGEWIALARGLISLGYDVIASLDCADMYSDDDLAHFCDVTQDIPFSYMIMEDTFGTLNEDRTNKLIQKCRHYLSVYSAKCERVGFLPRTTVENGLAQCNGAVAAGARLVVTTASTCDSSLLAMDTELALASFWASSASACALTPVPVLALTVPLRGAGMGRTVRRWLLTLTGLLRVHPREAVRLAEEGRASWQECCDELVALAQK